MYNNFSLLQLIGGLSKTLNIANQMIPIYKQVKPLISNSKNVLSNLQKLNINKATNINKQSIPNTQNIVSNTNSPTFFL